MNNISTKRYLQIFFTVLTIFSFYHFIIWYFYTSKIFDTGKYIIGDLARMSYQVDALFPRETKVDLPLQHINKQNYLKQEIDIITIGDSFFNGYVGGKNPFIQDYIATYTKKNVLNIQLFGNTLDIVNILINSGWLEKIKPQSIIIESTSRDSIGRFAGKFDFNKTLNIDTVQDKLFSDKWKLPIWDVAFINSANYKLPFYSLLYNYKQNAQKHVYKFKLKQNMFSIQKYPYLLLYHNDINALQKNTPSNVESLNKNINKLALKLKHLNIKLYFMPIVDKYDLYYEYIANNTYNKNIFFDLLRPMHKEYTLIDTKKILLPLVDNGVKDVFYSDDSHWSYKASDEVAKVLAKIIHKVKE